MVVACSEFLNPLLSASKWELSRVSLRVSCDSEATERRRAMQRATAMEL